MPCPLPAVVLRRETLGLRVEEDFGGGEKDLGRVRAPGAEQIEKGRVRKFEGRNGSVRADGRGYFQFRRSQ